MKSWGQTIREIKVQNWFDVCSVAFARDLSGVDNEIRAGVTSFVHSLLSAVITPLNQRTTSSEPDPCDAITCKCRAHVIIISEVDLAWIWIKFSAKWQSSHSAQSSNLNCCPTLSPLTSHTIFSRKAKISISRDSGLSELVDFARWRHYKWMENENYVKFQIYTRVSRLRKNIWRRRTKIEWWQSFVISSVSRSGSFVKIENFLSSSTTHTLHSLGRHFDSRVRPWHFSISFHSWFCLSLSLDWSEP